MNYLLSLLRKLPPELAHAVGLYGLDILHYFKTANPIINKTQCMGLNFPNPVGLAAGFDKNASHLLGLSNLGFGFIEVGTVTPLSQNGNPRPRLFRIKEQQAIINRMGFNNHGIDILIQNIRRDKLKIKLPVGINIGANRDTKDDARFNDYLIGLEKSYIYADYISLNISSPNTKDLRGLQKIDNLSRMLEVIVQKKSKLIKEHNRETPLVLKIAPDLEEAEIKDIADVCLALKIDGIIATNTTLTREGINAKIASEAGGMSGAPLFNKSLNVVSIVSKYANRKLCIIGCGGITTKEAAIQFKKEGADLVQIYTGLVYHGADLIRDISEAWKISN